MTLSFVGLGLGSVEYLTRGAEKALLSAEKVYLDTYTGYLSSELEAFLRNLLGERLIHADRKKLEDDLHEIVEEAREKEIVIAAPGDPLIATTHVSILLEAVKKGVSVRLIHGVSITLGRRELLRPIGLQVRQVRHDSQRGVGPGSRERLSGRRAERGAWASLTHTSRHCRWWAECQRGRGVPAQDRGKDRARSLQEG